MKYKVPFIKPELPPSEDLMGYYRQIIDANWFSNFGPLEQELCSESRKYIGENIAATTVSNATAGLMLAIKALITPVAERKQVLIPSFTFAAGAEAIIWCNCEPVFIDVSKETWQPDIDQARLYMGKNKQKVAGILFCNVFGVGAPEIDDWEALAQEFGVPLIIDSAAGFGSEYQDGSKLGGRGDCEIFSFHVTKPFGVGEGGLVSSKSQELINKIRKTSNFGFNKDKAVDELGFNGKMQEINAAMGLWQLKHIDSKIDRRQQVLGAYKDHLAEKGFRFQKNDDKSSVVFVSCLAPTAEIAQKLHSSLRGHGIESNRYYNPPLHKHPVFSRVPEAFDLKNTEDICDRIVSLPNNDMVDESVIKFIAENAS